MVDWHILTGEYPPQHGGVSDYTRLLASRLAEAGDSVHVWAPECAGETPADSGVEVHRLPGHFGPRFLASLGSMLEEFPAPRRILVQYVPQAFGWKGLNLPFGLWLRSRRNDAVWVMFHEVYFPLGWRQALSHNLLGAGTRLMASLVKSAAERKFVSIPAWMPLLSSRDKNGARAVWLPVPSTVPVIEDPSGVAEVRSRYAPEAGLIVGHFGTYGSYIADPLLALLPSLLAPDEGRVVLLLGRGGETVRDIVVRQHPALASRVHATGALEASDLSRHLAACDLMIQPFVDGISCRRTSAMAGLAHGLPIVTTRGFLTESIWAESESVALVDTEDVDGLNATVHRLLADAPERERLRIAARVLYQERFDVSHTISALRDNLSRNGG